MGRTTTASLPRRSVAFMSRHAEEPQSVERMREAQTSRTPRGATAVRLLAMRGEAESQSGDSSARAAPICVNVLHTCATHGAQTQIQTQQCNEGKGARCVGVHCVYS